MGWDICRGTVGLLVVRRGVVLIRGPILMAKPVAVLGVAGVIMVL